MAYLTDNLSLLMCDSKQKWRTDSQNIQMLPNLFIVFSIQLFVF